MIVRDVSQFRGTFRICFGIVGMALTIMDLRHIAEGGLKPDVHGVSIVIGCLSLWLLYAGISARRRPPMIRIDQTGFHWKPQTADALDVHWHDVAGVTQSGKQLILRTQQGPNHTFKLSGADHSSSRIATACLSESFRAQGRLSVRDAIVAAPPVLHCEECGKETKQLKTYLSYVALLAQVVGTISETRVTACPSCIRGSLYKFVLINMVTMNVMWPIVPLPYFLYHWINSFRSGHSPAIVDAIEEEAVRRLTT
ncbi:MAG: hypothetical protein JNL58_05665 [Planctomyces sp.]|nr:hypothetical protein [Planctomyces sp.]